MPDTINSVIIKTPFISDYLIVFLCLCQAFCVNPTCSHNSHVAHLTRQGLFSQL